MFIVKIEFFDDNHYYELSRKISRNLIYFLSFQNSDDERCLRKASKNNLKTLCLFNYDRDSNSLPVNTSAFCLIMVN